MKNFYNNKMNANQYFKILNNYKKKFTNKFILKNLGLFIGDKAFYKILKCFELIKETKNMLLKMVLPENKDSMELFRGEFMGICVNRLAKKYVQ